MINKENYNINAFHDAPLCVVDNDDLTQQRIIHLHNSCSFATIKGSVLEFGVHSGQTINIIANCFVNDTIYGFDSFEGLPEDWNVSLNEKYNKHKKGYFAVDELPEVRDNVQLVKGFFDKSLPEWLANNTINQIKFLHIDSDLYSSAKTVFDNLNSYIVAGTIIVFDEFYPWGRKRYETWEEHEYKALKEWIETYNRSFEVISRNNHQQCAIRIIK